VKSNPSIYRLREALDYYRSVAGVSWTICKNAEPGDILFVGQSGEEAGIYAKAIVADHATPEEVNDDFWVDPAGTRVSAWMAPIEGLTPMRHPLLESYLRAFPVLERAARWLHCQGKARHLSDEEGEASLRFIYPDDCGNKREFSQFSWVKICRKTCAAMC